MKLKIPDELNRNAPGIVKLGHEYTGQFIIEKVCQYIGAPNLANHDVLDIGCGVRLTGAFINRDIPIKSYTGIETEKKIVDFLQQNVSDPRFQYFYWNVHNTLYNPKGTPMSKIEELPSGGDYDVIWLFSVFTHQAPHDANDLLRLMRKHIRPEGFLVFTAFIDEALQGFEDRNEQSLLHAYYGRTYMEGLIQQNGWEVKAVYPPDERTIMQTCFVCKPQ